MKTNKENPSALGRLMSKISTDELELTEKKMHLASRIDEALRHNNLKKQEFAAMFDKSPSEITKWLSGTHNFTIETLWQIEKKLGIDLVNWQPNVQVVLISYSITNLGYTPSTSRKPEFLTNKLGSQRPISSDEANHDASLQTLIA